MNDNYEDIINLHASTSKKHPRMSISARAAQFAPFSALTGYKEAIKETERITEEEIFLDEDRKTIINEKLNNINKNIKENNHINLTYFIKDKNKQGGSIITENVFIKRIDLITEEIILMDKRKISLKNIIDINN